MSGGAPGLSATENLYYGSGTGAVVTSESIRRNLALETVPEDTMYLHYNEQGEKFKEEVSIMAGLRVMQGFNFSDKKGMYFGDFIIGLPMLFKLFEKGGEGDIYGNLMQHTIFDPFGQGI